jgi:erythromycin esterase
MSAATCARPSAVAHEHAARPAGCDSPGVPVKVSVSLPDGTSGGPGIVVAAIRRRSHAASSVTETDAAGETVACVEPGQYAWTATDARRSPAYREPAAISTTGKIELKLGESGPRIVAKVQGLPAGTDAYVRLIRSGNSTGDIFYAHVSGRSEATLGVDANRRYEVSLERGARSEPISIDIALKDAEVVIAGHDEKELRNRAPANVVQALSGVAIPLRTTSPTGAVDDLEALAPIIGGARIIAMGENSHGARENADIRLRFLKWMVEKHGLTALAIEAGVAETSTLDRYVNGGTGTAEETLALLDFWTWNNHETTHALEWLREHNAATPEERHVHIYGIDIQDPSRARNYLVDYLRKVDTSVADMFEKRTNSLGWPNMRVFLNLKPKERGEVEAAASDLVSTLDRSRDSYQRHDSGALSWMVARHQAVVLVQGLQYFNAASGGSALRDQAMAENVAWILERVGAASQVTLWAHNSHVAFGKSGSAGSLPLGKILREKFGKEYLSIGQFFLSGTVRAWDLTYPNDKDDSVEPVQIGPLEGGYIEETLADVSARVFALKMEDIAASAVLRDWFAVPRLRLGMGSDYINLADVTEFARLQDDFDMVLFCRVVTATSPVAAGLRGPHSH